MLPRLEKSVDERKNSLEDAERAQRYYFDASEAEQWMGEQELYMMSEEKAQVLRSEVLKVVTVGTRVQVVVSLPKN